MKYVPSMKRAITVYFECDCNNNSMWFECRKRSLLEMRKHVTDVEECYSNFYPEILTGYFESEATLEIILSHGFHLYLVNDFPDFS